MRMTFSAVAVAFLLLFGLAPAEARPRTADDDKKVEKLLGHADKISAILETDLDRPKKALKHLDKYLKKQRKPMKKLIGQLVKVANELDEEARSDFAQELMMNERSARFLKALSDFKEKHENDPAYGPKIEARFQELMKEGGKLVDALTQ